MRLLVLALSAALAGCGGAIVRDRPVTVLRPVAQPCAGERPAAVVPLAQAIPADQWDGMDVRQKAAAVGRQGLDLRTYGERLGAATGACP